MGSNKPKWSALKPWANFIACDEDGRWYQYANEPKNSYKSYSSKVSGYIHKWEYIGEFQNAGVDADLEWAKLHWATSVEARPKADENPGESWESSKKRVTLFIEFDSPVSNDAELAHLIAQAVTLKLNESALTACGGAADSVKVAVGVTKYEEIHYDPDNYEFFIEGEEPEHDDDDDDDDEEF